MPKSKACFASSVCCSDAFCNLPVSARALYYQLNFEMSTIGEIPGALRIARSYGFDDDDISALVDAGLIIEVGGRRFIRHCFEHNLLSNAGMKKAASNAFEKVSGIIAFEGEPFNSAYRILGSDSSNVSLMLDINSTQLNVTQPNVLETQINSNERIAPESRPCPRCSQPCAIAPEANMLHGWCERHGDFFIDVDNGCYIEGIS